MTALAQHPDLGTVDVPAERAFAFVRREMGVPRRELASRRRQRELVRARALFVWALRQLGVSYPRIGRALDRDHTSIMHLNRVAQELCTIDPAFADRCQRFLTSATAKPAGENP